MTTVVIGRYGQEHQERIRIALRRADEDDARFFADVEAAQSVLTDVHARVHCLFIADSDPAMPQLIASVRGTGHLFSVPVFVLVPHASDQAFAGAHAKGADDALLDTDLGGFTRRAALVRGYDPAVRPPVVQGGAVVVQPDPDRRRLLGRILRQAGFDVSFASSCRELVAAGRASASIEVAVIAAELSDGSPSKAVADLRTAMGRPELPAVVVARPSMLRAVALELAALKATVVTPENAPPDHLLFVANEVLRPGLQDLRTSPRMLCGTLCAFRPAGELLSVHGFTYNVSRHGLYVKTYDPPKNDTPLWIELRPPDDVSAVHLRGSVVWARHPNHASAAIVPPGFGVRLDEAACPPRDWSRYQTAYERLCQEWHALSRAAA